MENTSPSRQYNNTKRNLRNTKHVRILYVLTLDDIVSLFTHAYIINKILPRTF